MNKIKFLIAKIASYFPTSLPVGMKEFDAFSKSIVLLVGNLADEDSLKFAMSSMIMHLGPQRSTIPKNYFVQSLRKTAANQVAHAVLMDLKNKQQAAAEAAKLAEETAKIESEKGSDKDGSEEKKENQTTT